MMLSKDNNPNWKGGISDREWKSRTAIARVKRKRKACERCGSTANLQGHHRLPYADFPEKRDAEENIEIICADCHAKEHPHLAGMIMIPRQRSGVYLECRFCKAKFYRPKCHASGSKFCSRKCQYDSWRGKKWEEIRYAA
jgi:hypothetical protein